MSTPQQLKLHKRLELENHLHFTLHCKHHGVVPSSLKLKCSMRGKGVDNILRKAQKSLLNERITRIYGQLDFLKRTIADLNESVFSQLHNQGTLYEEVVEWCNNIDRRTFDQVRDRQRAKFSALWRKRKAPPRMSLQ